MEEAAVRRKLGGGSWEEDAGRRRLGGSSWEEGAGRRELGEMLMQYTHTIR